LISRLDADAQLRLRRALVRQALTYAEAVRARARRWELDAAYAILCGAEPLPLELPTGA